jgi:integrase
MGDRIRVHVVKYRECKNLILRYKDPVTGKHVRKSSGTASMKDAHKEAARWEDDLNSGKARGRFKVSWEDFRLRYEQEVLPGLAPKTAEKVDSIFNTLERNLPQVKNGLLRELNAERISALQKALRDAGRAEATIAGHLAHLRAALAWAVDQGLISELPKIKKPKRARRGGGADPMKGRPITTEEFERMLAAVPKALAMPTFRGKPRPRKDPARKIKPKPKVEYTPTAQEVESWRRLLRGLWWSGLRLGEALQLYWDRPDRLCVDLSGRRPMLRILGEFEKGNRDRLLPIAPEFAEFLLATPEAERRGRVFRPESRTRGVVSTVNFVCRIIADAGRIAGVKVLTDPSTGKVKFASAHDLRRSFGERWASRVMPQVLMALMRHEKIDTTMRYYVGRNANTTADAVWSAYEKSQEGTVLGTVADLGAKKEGVTFDITPCDTNLFSSEGDGSRTRNHRIDSQSRMSCNPRTRKTLRQRLFQFAPGFAPANPKTQTPAPSKPFLLTLCRKPPIQSTPTRATKTKESTRATRSPSSPSQ